MKLRWNCLGQGIHRVFAFIEVLLLFDIEALKLWVSVFIHPGITWIHMVSLTLKYLRSWYYHGPSESEQFPLLNCPGQVKHLRWCETRLWGLEYLGADLIRLHGYVDQPLIPNFHIPKLLLCAPATALFLDSKKIQSLIQSLINSWQPFVWSELAQAPLWFRTLCTSQIFTILKMEVGH